MSISATISQYAATNPAVAVAVSEENTKNALLSSMQSGSSAGGGILSALDQNQTEIETLLGNATESHLGQNLDIQA